MLFVNKTVVYVPYTIVYSIITICVGIRVGIYYIRYCMQAVRSQKSVTRRTGTRRKNGKTREIT
jgi:uncharacterized membrane-anchored protein YhcB (DUF1043 family)